MNDKKVPLNDENKVVEESNNETVPMSPQKKFIEDMKKSLAKKYTDVKYIERLAKAKWEMHLSEEKLKKLESIDPEKKLRLKQEKAQEHLKYILGGILLQVGFRPMFKEDVLNNLKISQNSKIAKVHVGTRTDLDVEVLTGFFKEVAEMFNGLEPSGVKNFREDGKKIRDSRSKISEKHARENARPNKFDIEAIQDYLSEKVIISNKKS